jgi:hypothetical protein
LKPTGFTAARWIRLAELTELPLNVSARKLAKFAASRSGLLATE